ncbi:tetratricopeptide repeat protein [Thalassomonas sp. RHCl1]|uniref:tetratricopeptide repeat protein n=1 Tax=Thalassomonas sp. RHCl1 TaxID=2995320 RepID=UPI00248B4F75|nr:tetratricopeptide repeat protein [Thalassomonas sp. RHCl1]
MAAVDYSNKRFLIVDNVKPSRDTLKHLAQSLNAARADTSHHPRHVVSMCKNMDYDIILLGYDLGEGQRNGQQILEELRVNDIISRQCIVIIVTAEVSQAMVLAALEHKPDEYLSKPFAMSELLKRLHRCFLKKRAMANIYTALDNEEPEKVIELCELTLRSSLSYRSECLGIKARQHFELGQYEEAKEIYQAQQNSPNCQWATIGLGKIALMEDELDVAEQYFKAVIEESPRYLSTYDWLAKTYQKQHQYEKAEEILERALLISPRSVGRLKEYADLCLENEHFDKATDAYQKTNDLAYHSIHHKPENALKLARSLVEYSSELEPHDIKKMNTKAFKALAVMNREFTKSEFKIQSHLLSACLFTNSKEQTSARDMLQKAETLLEEKLEEISPDSMVEIAKSFVKLNKKDKAQSVLAVLSQQYPEDLELMNEVDKFSDVPMNKDDKEEAQKALEVGVSLYKEKNYSLAIEKLNDAFKLFPTHQGIKLNLLQVLLVSYETNPGNTAHLQQAEIIIDALDDLSEGDSAYIRFEKLKEKYNQLYEQMME